MDRNHPHRNHPLRLGPRPLPQHLSLAAATWLNSGAILPALRLGSQNWAAPQERERERESERANP